jgi:glucans biosynthesis protein
MMYAVLLRACNTPLIKTLIIACLLSAPSVNAEDDVIAPFTSDMLKIGFFDNVIAKARKLAAEPYEAPKRDLPEALVNMDYDQYRSIRFRPEAALWRDQSAFEVQLFHPGFLFLEPVNIAEITDNQPNNVGFRPDFFSYDGTAAKLAGQVPMNTGFAGFRVHYPLNDKAYKDEFLVFQGASYFRIVGPGQAYGLSARGLAIDTAEAKGEEFPVFREFWLEKPKATDNHLVIYALLDSKSLAGAYRFDITPGGSVEVKVQAELFARTDIQKLGVAPLTSMFMWGENRTRFYDDFRPEVHDSDGILMAVSNGEWVWRPLSNHRQLHVSSLSDINPKGFGLMQRDRQFDHYLDMEAKYEQRPSIWITPDNNWGKGRVELVEIPSDSEVNDNIVSYWVPESSPKAGEHRSFSYTLRTLDAQMSENPYARVLRTRIGAGSNPGHHNPLPKSHRRFVVDFRGGDLEGFSANAAITPQLQVGKGKVTDLLLQRLADNKTWRASFILEPEDGPADMRLFLQLGEQRISEVWSYVWYADAID